MASPTLIPEDTWLTISEVRKQLKFIETYTESITRDTLLPCGIPAGQFCIEFLLHKSKQNRKHIGKHYERKTRVVSDE